MESVENMRNWNWNEEKIGANFDLRRNRSEMKSK
jgi:hypothetical protein